MKKIAAFVSVIIIVISCSSNEIANSKDVNPATIYTDYAVTHHVGDDYVNCFLQYRFGGINGTTLVLSSPASVAIDGTVLTADSSDFSGAYYQNNFPVDGFNGAHTISYTDYNGSVLKQPFEFHSIQCSNAPTTIQRNKDLELNFTGTGNRDSLYINISDTSADTNDIDTVFALQHAGKIIIAAQQLQQLKQGTCNVSVYRKTYKDLQITAEGGRLVITDEIINKDCTLK